MSEYEMTLDTFVAKSAEKQKLEARVTELNEQLDYLEQALDEGEGKLPSDKLDALARKYNEINSERIELSLKINQLDRELLLFEYFALTKE